MQRMNLAKKSMGDRNGPVNMTLENRPGREEFPTGPPS
jgi:hypothetical protein